MLNDLKQAISKPSTDIAPSCLSFLWEVKYLCTVGKAAFTQYKYPVFSTDSFFSVEIWVLYSKATQAEPGWTPF